uniref:Calpain catalytic domain-containing protein n=1 Tax=Panagrolaimus superbus TaxID=310955 RepID=A0A914YAS3_9BILA
MDRLPTLEGKLMYLSSSDNTEFWGAVLEKAYAKLYGSYEALEGGWISEALGDMTGGLTEIIDIKSPSQNLLRIIFRGIKLGSLFGCSIIKKSSEAEGQPPYGLKNNHAYSITGMQIVKGPMGIPTPLIRIRNPWGDEQEWTGPWSDNSSEWDNVSLNQRININLKFENDGESWMPFDDFTKYFETLEICHIDPNIMKNVYHHNHPPSESHDTWSVQTFHGVWRRRVTAGGSLKYLQTYLLNPQYLISLDDSQHEDEDNSCTLIIGVLQKYRRELKHEGVQNLSINFALYEIEDNLDKKLDTDFFVRNEPIFESNPVFDGYLREITSRIRVPPGKYVIVPSTKERHEEANFMLRIFTDGIIESK